MVKTVLSASAHSAQKARIYPLRAEILRRIDDGQSVRRIRLALGLDDIPASTFYENVKKLRLTHAPAAASEHARPRSGAATTADPHGPIPARPDPAPGKKTETASRPRGKTLRIGSMSSGNLPPTNLNPETWGI